MATVRTWIGGQHDYYDPASWTPNGTPMASDTATIGLGTAADPNVASVTNNVLSGTATVLDGGSGGADLAADPTLSLNNVIIGPDASVTASSEARSDDIVGGVAVPLTMENLDVNGLALNYGTISQTTTSNTLDINLGNYTALLNQAGGTISAGDFSYLTITGNKGPAVLVNNGTVSSTGGSIDVGTAVWGVGTFDMTTGPGFVSRGGHGSTLEFQQSVSDGQTVSLNGSGLLLDSPSSFLGTIDDKTVIPAYYPGDSFVELVNETVTSLSFQNDVLTAYDGSAVLANLKFAPGLKADEFTYQNISANDGLNLPAGTRIFIATTGAVPASLSVAPPQTHT